MKHPGRGQEDQDSTGGASTSPQRAQERPTILFTAFEPSGDAHAAPVIRELLRREPGIRIFSSGGPLPPETRLGTSTGSTISGRLWDTTCLQFGTSCRF